MATRQEVERRRQKLLAHLRAICDRQAVVGGLLPPIRQLADEYEVSTGIVHAVVRSLREEGLVDSVPGAGTRIVTRRFEADELYLYLQDRPVADFLRGPDGAFSEVDPRLTGFTDRLAERGAFAVAIPGLDALAGIDLETIVGCRGFFGRLWDDVARRRLHPPLPVPAVGYFEHADPELEDRVQWDDRDAGRTAAEHLLSLGHRTLAFVGDFDAANGWAHRRAEGFREAVAEAGWDGRAHVERWDDPGLVPDTTRDETMTRLARQSAGQLLARGLPDAIVAANDLVAVSILQELRTLDVGLSRWPAIIGFDDVGVFAGQEIASMRADRRMIGRAAADLLWERAHGLLQGPPKTVEVPMTLVPRLSSQPGWAYRLHRLFSDFPHPPAARRPAPEGGRSIV